MWYYNNQEIRSINDLPENAYGIIYKIINLSNGKYYIGKKNLYSERKVKLGKKELALQKDKRLSKFKHVQKESDWLKYTGSCIELNNDIKEGHNIHKEILEVTFSKRQTTYKEVLYLFKYDVLEDENCYNSNILSLFFKGNLK